MLILSLLATLAVAAPHPFNSHAGILTRGENACSTESALVCSSDGSQYAICSWGHADFQAVAAGTKCVCAGDSSCNIAPANDDAPSANPPPPPPAPPAPVVTSVAPIPSPHVHKHASNSQKPSTHPHKSSATPPAYSSPSAPSPPSKPYTYKTYLGNGSSSSGWPTPSEWLSFDTLWTTNLNHISTSCTAFNQPNNSPEESEQIRQALLSESQSCGVDPRLALAQMLQESGGCVRVPTTNYGVNNPGLFQSHNGQGTCADADPCPDSEIVQMVKDGISGTADGDGLKGVIAQAQQEGYEGVAADYAGLRIYNSGSVAPSGLLQDGIATHCYVSDIANRLMGWTDGVTGCTLDG